MSIWSRLFGTKASAAGAAISGTLVGQPTWTPRNYAQLSDEGYRKNIVAFRSVHIVARGCASVPWTLMNGDTEIEDHPLLDLLHRPNPMQAGAALFEALIAYRLLAGNSYLEMVTGADGRTPVELYAQRPDRMTVIVGDDGMPQGYRYKVGQSVPVDWPRDILTGDSDILHWKTFHPLNDWYGMSPLEAAAWSVDQHNSASQWNQALLQNSARPAGVMTYAPKEGPTKLAPDQFSRLKAQIDEQYSGASKAGRVMLLDGGMAWTSMSLSPLDMDFLNGKHASARDIAQAFGVPSQMLGIPGDNTYANYAEARMALWEDTIIPTLDDLCDALNQRVLPRFDAAGVAAGRLRLSYDLDEIAALAPKREAKWTAIQGATFLTTNEKREALDYEPITDVPEADDVLVPTTMQPLGTQPPAPVAPGAAAGGAADASAEADMAKSLRRQGMSTDAATELARLAYGDA